MSYSVLPDAVYLEVSSQDVTEAGVTVRQHNCPTFHHTLTASAVPIVVIEPIGSNAFYSSMALNMSWREMYQLEDIKGIAADMDIVEGRSGTRIAHLRSHETHVTSLTAASPAPKIVSRAILRDAGAICVCVPDEMMMSAALSFAGNASPLSRLLCNC